MSAENILKPGNSGSKTENDLVASCCGHVPTQIKGYLTDSGGAAECDPQRSDFGADSSDMIGIHREVFIKKFDVADTEIFLERTDRLSDSLNRMGTDRNTGAESERAVTAVEGASPVCQQMTDRHGSRL